MTAGGDGKKERVDSPPAPPPGTRYPMPGAAGESDSYGNGRPGADPIPKIEDLREFVGGPGAY